MTESGEASSGQDFKHEATHVVARVRSAFASALAEIPGGVRRAVDLRRALGIDPALAWSVYRAATSAGDLSAVANLPGAIAMANFFAAAEAAGVSKPHLHAARRAYEEFLRLIERHADDRASFNSMLRELDGGSHESADLKQRRAAFRANTHIWGVHARVNVSTLILRPKAEGDAAEGILVKGYVGLRRIRQGLRIAFGVRSDTANEGPVEAQTLKSHGFELLTQFSSPPRPEMQERRDAAGYVRAEIVNPDYGRRAETTLFTAKVIRKAFSIPQPAEDSTASYETVTPTEILLRDILVFDGLEMKLQPEVSHYTRALETPNGRRFDEADLLPVAGRLVRLGTGIGSVEASEVPRYGEILHYVLAELAWGEHFTAYRCREEYPVMRAIGVIRWT